MLGTSPFILSSSSLGECPPPAILESLLEHGEVILQSLEQLLRVAMFRVHLQRTGKGVEEYGQGKSEAVIHQQVNPDPHEPNIKAG